LVENIGAAMRRGSSQICWRESGQALVLIALMVPVLIGFLGLAVDFGRLASQQRVLQNQADAAALAGGADLSEYYQSACTDASTSLTTNGATATSTCSVYQTNYPNDTIKVTLTQSLPMDFMPVLGIKTQTLTATAVAEATSITSCSGNWSEFEPGELVIIRSSQSGGWVNGTPGTDGSNAGNCGSDWTVSANDFKGFLRPYGSSYFQVGNNILTKGGNACGQEPVTDIQNAFTSGQVLVIPVLNTGAAGQGQGNPQVHIINFVTVRLNFTYPYSGQIQAVTINGAPTGGTFTLTFNGKTTSPIAYNATANAVQAALAGLSTIGGNTNNDSTSNVLVVENSDGSYTITFQNTMAGSQPTISANASGLTGGSSPSIMVTLTATNTAKAGQASTVSDFTCPATWWALVVDDGIGATDFCTGSSACSGQCNSSGIACRVSLVQ
jgi:Flp pilus assembly protein TadG